MIRETGPIRSPIGVVNNSKSTYSSTFSTFQLYVGTCEARRACYVHINMTRFHGQRLCDFGLNILGVVVPAIVLGSEKCTFQLLKVKVFSSGLCAQVSISPIEPIHQDMNTLYAIVTVTLCETVPCRCSCAIQPLTGKCWECGLCNLFIDSQRYFNSLCFSSSFHATTGWRIEFDSCTWRFTRFTVMGLTLRKFAALQGWSTFVHAEYSKLQEQYASWATFLIEVFSCLLQEDGLL